MNTSIYDKTDKGREEIATRKHQLATRLRALLVLVDGRRPEEELLRNVAGLGLTQDALRELAAQGYIAPAGAHAAPPSQPSQPSSSSPASPASPPSSSSSASPASPASPPPQLPPDPVRQFQQVYDFYNKTIKSSMGLRGFTLQLKVEKAASLDDLRQLRDAYLEGVTKAKGRETAALLVQQLDRLLA